MSNHFPLAIVRSAVNLKAAAAEINAELRAAEECQHRGAEHFRRAGLKLLEIKPTVGHGNWEQWIQGNLGSSVRQAQRWMKLAKATPASDLDEQWRIILGHSAEDETEDEEA